MAEKYFPKSKLGRLWGKITNYVDKKFNDVNPVGLFSLQYDPATGNLYAVYPDGTAAPQFEYDTTTGNLYYITSE